MKDHMRYLTLLQMIQKRHHDTDFTRNFKNYLRKHFKETQDNDLISQGILLLAKNKKIAALDHLLKTFPNANIKMLDEEGKSVLDYLRSCKSTGGRRATDKNQAIEELTRRFAEKKPFTIFDILSSDHQQAMDALKMFLKAFPGACEAVNQEGIDALTFAINLKRIDMAAIIQAVKQPLPAAVMTLQPLTLGYSSIGEPVSELLYAQDELENFDRFINISI